MQGPASLFRIDQKKGKRNAVHEKPCGTATLAPPFSKTVYFFIFLSVIEPVLDDEVKRLEKKWPEPVSPG